MTTTYERKVRLKNYYKFKNVDAFIGFVTFLGRVINGEKNNWSIEIMNDFGTIETTDKMEFDRIMIESNDIYKVEIKICDASKDNKIMFNYNMFESRKDRTKMVLKSRDKEWLLQAEKSILEELSDHTTLIKKVFASPVFPFLFSIFYIHQIYTGINDTPFIKDKITYNLSFSDIVIFIFTYAFIFMFSTITYGLFMSKMTIKIKKTTIDKLINLIKKCYAFIRNEPILSGVIGGLITYLIVNYIF